MAVALEFSGPDFPATRAALFFTRTYNRVLRPGLAQIVPVKVLDDSELRRAFDPIDAAERWIAKAKVPA
jgi:hypothetical protein